MSKMIFVNLPVRDLTASTAFYVALGEHGEPAVFGRGVQLAPCSRTRSGVMLLTHDHYRGFPPSALSATRAAQESQTLLALTVDNDAIARNADPDPRGRAAGGNADPNPVQDHVVSMSVPQHLEDPNGYVWEIMRMDAAAAAGTPETA